MRWGGEGAMLHTCAVPATRLQRGACYSPTARCLLLACSALQALPQADTPAASQVYDERGFKYDLPNFVASAPTNLAP